MRRRRWLIIGSAFAIVALAGFLLLQNAPLAQPEGGPGPPPEGEGPPMPPEGEMGGPGMEPGMEPGMMEPGMGGPGMGGPGGGGAAGLGWTEDEPPEELTMTYDEYIAETGNAPTVPDNLTTDEEGEPKKETFNAWAQLQRVYGEAGAIEEAPAGRVGGPLARQMEGEIAYSMDLIKKMASLYSDAADGFSCKVGYPVSATGRNGPGQFPTQVPVILQVRRGFQKTFGTKCYNRLKRFDRPELSIGNPMSGLVNSFTVHTYKQGHWRPLQLQLGPGASIIWNMLWSQNSIRLTIYNKLGEEIYSEEQSANQGPDILSSIVSPPELHYQPRHRMLLPTEDLAFNGGRLNLNGTRGWLFMFDITSMPPEAYRQMDSAEAEFIISDDTEQAVDEAATEIENLVRQTFGREQRGGGPEGMGPEGMGPGGPMGPEGMPEDEMMPPP